MTVRETRAFGLPSEIHGRRIDSKLLLFNGLVEGHPSATNLAVIAIQAQRVNGEWLVGVADPAAPIDQRTSFGSFIEPDGSLSQKEILVLAERWIRSAAATKRVPGKIYPASDPFTPTVAVGYLLVEAAEAALTDATTADNRMEASDVSCQTCVAACCRKGMTIMLTDKEASQQRRAMSLQRIKASVNYARDIPVQVETVDIAGNVTKLDTTLHVPKYRGVYALREHCGNLGESADGSENRPCKIHNDDGYPEACEAFEVGSPSCLAKRAEYGLDGHLATHSLDDTAPVKVRTWTP